MPIIGIGEVLEDGIRGTHLNRFTTIAKSACPLSGNGDGGSVPKLEGFHVLDNHQTFSWADLEDAVVGKAEIDAFNIVADNHFLEANIRQINRGIGNVDNLDELGVVVFEL